MASQTVVSKGIFHGLPTFPEYDGGKISIIVTGANGISGSAMVKVLAEAPERWDKIYALSRRPGSYPTSSNIVSIAVDFLNSTPEAIAKILKDHNVQAQNVALLTNFLDALPLASIKPKRTLLQTGAKYYGLHLGPTSAPMDEADPRHEIEGNFYFPQEDLLFEYSRKNDSTWVITRPCFILGAAEGATMNIVYPLSVYAAVQAHLSRTLDFPGDIPAWDVEKHQSTAMLIAYHAEWALLTPDAANKALNHSDSSMFSWGKFWLVLADWYHLPAGRPADDPAAYATLTMPYTTSPRGFGGPGVIKPSFSFLEWSKKPEVLKVWEELKAKHGLKDSPFGDEARENFGLLDGEMMGGWGRSIAMDRNRKLGWHGYVDTKEAIRSVINDMAKLKMVPPLK